MRASSPAARAPVSGRLNRLSSGPSNVNQSEKLLAQREQVSSIRDMSTILNTSTATIASDQNIRVAARVRPKTTKEANAGVSINVPSADEARDGIWPSEMIVTSSNAVLHNAKQKFRFDAVFPESASQEAVFEEMAAPLVRAVCGGFNAALFAYGQTGTGKTHTMLGEDIWMLASRKELTQKQRDSLESSDVRGVIPRAMKLLFMLLSSRPHKVSVSYLEIYNEKILDLLADASPTSGLELREDKNGSVQICDLTVKRVSTVEEVFDQLWKGAKNRAVSSTDMNEHSSRSHTIFQVFVETKGTEQVPGTRAKLNLVDLAGSEKWRPHQLSEFSDQRIAEMTSINQSLSNLGNCVRGLLKPGGSKHIPFRNSKLTRILQDSLGGSSQCGFVVTVSPSELAHEETISTLQFADRVKRVQVKAEQNVVETPETMLRKLEQELGRAREENKTLKQRLDSLASSSSVVKSVHNDAWSKPNSPSEIANQSDQENAETNIRKLVKKASATSSSLASPADSEGDETFLKTYLDHLKQRKADDLAPLERLALLEWALAMQQTSLAQVEQARQALSTENLSLSSRLGAKEREFTAKVQDLTLEKIKLQEELIELKAKMVEEQHQKSLLLARSIPLADSTQSREIKSTTLTTEKNLVGDVRSERPATKTSFPGRAFVSSAQSSEKERLNQYVAQKPESEAVRIHQQLPVKSISTETESLRRVESSRPPSRRGSLGDMTSQPATSLSQPSRRGSMDSGISSRSNLSASVSTSRINQSDRPSSFEVSASKPSSLEASIANRSVSFDASNARRGSITDDVLRIDSMTIRRQSPMTSRASNVTPAKEIVIVSSSSARQMSQNLSQNRPFNSSRASPAVVKTSSATKVQLWDRFVDESTGRAYFHCKETGETTWRRPSGAGGEATVIIRGE